MKVYIVTSGCYSEYRIEKVFTNREKAEKYVLFHSGGYDEPKIEEYETEGDFDFYQIKYFYARYEVDEGEEKFHMNFNFTTSLDTSEEEASDTYYFEYHSRDHKCLIIKRVIRSEPYDESALENKYKQVCRDLYSKIKSLREIEGWDEKMVQEWLNENAKKYVPEFE